MSEREEVQTAVIIPDPRWPWNPRFTVPVAVASQTFTGDGADMQLRATGASVKGRVGLRVSLRYWWGRLSR